MSDTPIKVHTEDLDNEPAEKPVDEKPATTHNQDLSRKPLRSLNLETKIPKQTGDPMTKNQKKMLMMLGAVAIVAGLGTGFGAFKLKEKASGNGSPTATQQVAGDVINNGDVFGVKDDQTFKDSAEGYLAAGGVDGEGSHSLLREGGPSQTVYLTSSITDLDKLVGMKVKVWGETFKGQKAGWLMDVGRIEVIEVDATAPAEAEE
jgi:hypothetical protein